MIHNPDVNQDLTGRGVRFLQDTHGQQLISFDSLTSEDIVMIPAFGAPLELLSLLEQRGIATEKYNTTCPFVERVWKKSEQIGQSAHTIIIHGKYQHEETRSTFSRSARDSGAAVVVRDMAEAEKLAAYIHGHGSQTAFENEFKERFSKGFDITKHFVKVGVINQTTMLAAETQAIADFFKNQMVLKFGPDQIAGHYADTRDTLCYATNENQDATYGLLNSEADLALVIGGYNSSNTSHLADLLATKFKTYFISSAQEIKDDGSIQHFDYATKQLLHTSAFLPKKDKLRIILTSGASCPDSILEAVMDRINSFYNVLSQEQVLKHLQPV
jgi:4-hydroxy-3-methylbut-2-enyl diphosphate reductase